MKYLGQGATAQDIATLGQVTLRSNNLSDLSSIATARANLGLGVLGGANLLYNSEFLSNASGSIDGWLNGSSYYLESGTGYIGGNSLLFLTGAGYQFQYQNITFKANQTYTVSYYIKADSGFASTGGSGVVCDEGFGPVSGTAHYLETSPPTTWTRRSFTFTVGTSDSSGAHVLATNTYGGSTSGGACRISNVQVEMASTATAYAPARDDALPKVGGTLTGPLTGGLTISTPTTTNTGLKVFGRIQTGTSGDSNGGVWLDYANTKFVGDVGNGSVGLFNGSWLFTQSTTATYTATRHEVAGYQSKVDGALVVGANSLQGDMVVFVDTFDGTTINATNWKVTQSTAGNVSQNNSITVVGNSSWTTNGLTGVNAYRRSSTLTLVCDVVLPSSATNAMVGFSSSPASLNYANMPHGLYFNGNALLVYENASSVNTTYTLTPSTKYRARIEVAPVGATYWMSTDGGDTWTKVYDSTAGTVNTSPLYPQVTVYNPNGVTLDNLVVSNGDDYLSRSQFFDRNLTVGGVLAVNGTASAATPTAPSHLATKAYVDAGPLVDGGTLTTNNTNLAANTYYRVNCPQDGTNYQFYLPNAPANGTLIVLSRIDAGDNGVVLYSSGSGVGPVSGSDLISTPIGSAGAYGIGVLAADVTFRYLAGVWYQSTTLSMDGIGDPAIQPATSLSIAARDSNGQIYVSGDPTDANHTARKQYVDTQIASNFQNVFVGSNGNASGANANITVPGLWSVGPAASNPDSTNTWFYEIWKDNSGSYLLQHGYSSASTSSPAQITEAFRSYRISTSTWSAWQVRPIAATVLPPVGYTPPSGGYTMPSNVLSVAAGAPPSGQASFYPMDVGQGGFTTQAIALSLTTLQVGGTGTLVQAALYSDRGDGGGPLLTSAGLLFSWSVNCTSAGGAVGTRSQTYSTTLAAGRYWTCLMYYQGTTAPSTAPQFMCATNATSLWDASANPLTVIRALTVTGLTNLPIANQTISGTGASTAPIVVLRRA